MKRLLSVMLVIAMVLTFAVGCGSDTKDNGADSGKDTFFIGGIGPVTGDASIYGQAVKNGAQIAVDEINAAGGINGYPVKFEFQDDESDAEKSINAYNTLKDKGMQVLMGTVTSTPCVAVADKTKEDNMFQITPSGSSTDVLKNGNVFQVCFTDPRQGETSAQYIAKNSLATKIAVIYDSSDTYSTGIYTAFAEEAKNQGLEIVAKEAFTSESKSDFSVQIQKAKDAGAELLFLPIYYKEASLILTQAGSQGYEPIFLGCDGLDGILGVDNFDISLAEDVILLTPFTADAQDELTTKFVSTYKEDYKEIPNQFAADAYDAIYIIKTAIEGKNLTPDMSVSEICDAMNEAMLEISVTGLTSGGNEMKWEATGEVNKTPMAVIIKDGAYIVQ